MREMEDEDVLGDKRAVVHSSGESREREERESLPPIRRASHWRTEK